MVNRKLDKNTLLDLYTLYHDSSNDFTLKYLANKVGISRSRLGKLFKKINSDTLNVNYGNDEKYCLALNDSLNGTNTVSNIAQKYSVSRATLYRKIKRLSDGK